MTLYMCYGVALLNSVSSQQVFCGSYVTETKEEAIGLLYSTAREKWPTHRIEVWAEAIPQRLIDLVATNAEAK